MLTNYDRVLIGQEEALESGAFVARVADSTAGWYNPAGLALVRRSVIGASATGYELATVDLGDIRTASGKVSLAQLPSYFGAVLGGDVISSDRWRIGFSATKPTSWSTALNGATPDGNAEVTYSSRVSISTLVPAISAAWSALPSLRLGAGFGVAITSIFQTQILSVATDPPYPQDFSVLRTADGTGTTWGGQGIFGVQWDVTDKLLFGASLRTPTFTIIRTGGLTYQDSTIEPRGGRPDDRRDVLQRPGRDLHLQAPPQPGLRARLAGAPLRRRGGRPLPLGNPEVLPALLGTAGGRRPAVPGGGQTVTTTAFPGLTYAANAVWNFSIGGRYQLDEAWSLHGGFYTDAAPSDPASTNVFRSVNLYGLTAGAKLKGDHLSGSLGLGLTWGSSNDFPSATPDSVPFSTRLSILTVSLLYAIAYRF